MTRKRKIRLKNGTNVKAKKHVSTKPLPWNGDHGTGTAAANENTILVPLKDDPNRRAQRVRVDQVRLLIPLLTMRQHQAAQAIQNAYTRCEMLSSGSPLKEQVDASPKPDASVAAQVDAQSRLHLCMSGVLRGDIGLVHDICWHDVPRTRVAKRHTRWLDRFRNSMDKVADRLGY